MGHPSSSARLVRSGHVWMLVALVLITLNLRPAMSAVSALLTPLKTGLGLSGTEVSVLTSIPTLGMAVFAFLGPAFCGRFGEERLIAGSALLLLAGNAVRLVPSAAAMFGGTILIAAAIGLVTGAIPGLVKRRFADRFAGMMALYTVALTLGASGASALAPELAPALGSAWSLPLAVVTVPPAVLASVWWAVALRKPAAGRAYVRIPAALWRDRLAWKVTIFFGCTGLLFYFVLGWLPTICRDRGMGATASGLVLSFVSLVQVAGSLGVPVVIRRLRDQRRIVAGVVVLNAAGLAGVMLAPVPAGVWAAAVVLGLGQGGGFGLAMTLIGFRSPDPATAAGLSGMAQGTGYAISAVGPLGAGLLHAAFGGWSVTLGVVLAVCLVQLAAGLGAGRTGYVLDGEPATPVPTRTP